jgi:hypothetical protein
MAGFRFWLRRNLTRLAITLGIFCYIEIFFSLTEGTNRNFEFPWGYYEPSLAVLGALLLAGGWYFYVPPRIDESRRPVNVED